MIMDQLHGVAWGRPSLCERVKWCCFYSVNPQSYRLGVMSQVLPGVMNGPVWGRETLEDLHHPTAITLPPYRYGSPESGW